MGAADGMKEEEESPYNSFPILNLNRRESIKSSHVVITGDSPEIFPRAPLLPKRTQPCFRKTVLSLPKLKGALTAISAFKPKIKDPERRCETATGLYTPVEFDIEIPPLPFMGPDVRQIGKFKRVSTETVALKKNEVHEVNLKKFSTNISRGRDKALKDHTRTLLIWHLEGQRSQNHKNHARERRTRRILNFVDKLSIYPEVFHFDQSFYNDLARSEYDPESPPPPLRPTEKRPLPKRKERPQKSSFGRSAAKDKALQDRFADCELAGKISGYTYVKLYTDPYYRYLPPLSVASKHFDIRLTRLPHKELRDEKLWAAFLKSLERKPTPPPPKKSGPKATDFGVMAKERNEQLRRKLPVISVLPKWLQQAKFNQSCKFEVTESPTRTPKPMSSGTGALKPPIFSPEEDLVRSKSRTKNKNKIKHKNEESPSTHRVTQSTDPA